MRSNIRYQLDDVSTFKNQLLNWARQFDVFIWLDSNDHQDPYGSFDAILALGAETCLKMGEKGAFSALAQYRNTLNDWLFGYLGYDLKNDIEPLSSENHDSLGFPELYFFQPQKIIRINGQTAEFLYLGKFENDIPNDIEAIKQSQLATDSESPADIPIKLRIFKDEYRRRTEQILRHIHRGDIYELNFCQEFYAPGAKIDPLSVYLNLNRISRPPFAAFMRFGEHSILSASPERFLKKEGLKIISQPIKGTARRSDNTVIDLELRHTLASDPKERAENIMITDLVRNDLSKHAIKGSVFVKELCKVYSYKQVHQMISTVEATIPKETDPVEIIKDAFPMGSMTGAPKISSMELIEKYESSKRGVYSGALGYFGPENDFDFSVIIRSILYNDLKKYLSFSVGSAITSMADPDNEYQECLVKARAMRKVLEPSARYEIEQKWV